MRDVLGSNKDTITPKAKKQEQHQKVKTEPKQVRSSYDETCMHVFLLICCMCNVRSITAHHRFPSDPIMCAYVDLFFSPRLFLDLS